MTVTSLEMTQQQQNQVRTYYRSLLGSGNMYWWTFPVIQVIPWGESSWLLEKLKFKYDDKHVTFLKFKWSQNILFCVFPFSVAAVAHTELKAPVNEPAALWLAPPDTCPCIRRRAEQDWIIHLVTSVCGGQNCCWLCSHILHLWAGFVFFLSSSEGFLLYSSLIWGEWLFNKLLCDACQDRLTSMCFFFFFFLAGIPSIPGVHRREGKTWWVLFPYVF